MGMWDYMTVSQEGSERFDKNKNDSLRKNLPSKPPFCQFPGSAPRSFSIFYKNVITIQAQIAMRHLVITADEVNEW
jgi:hypothetical protein